MYDLAGTCKDSVCLTKPREQTAHDRTWPRQFEEHPTMLLREHWKQAVAENGFDTKLSSEDLQLLEKVYFTGAVACFGEMRKRDGNDIASLENELKEFVDSHRS